MRRRALAAIALAVAVLGSAPRAHGLTCMLVPLIDPRGSTDQIVAHVRVVGRPGSRDAGGVIRARILDVLAGTATRGMARIDASWVWQWRAGPSDPLPPGSEWVVVLTPAAWGSRADCQVPRCRALLAVSGETVSGHLSSAERTESMTLPALKGALRSSRPSG
jgi:hypothetical protein